MKARIPILLLTMLCLAACRKEEGSTSTVRLTGIQHYGSVFTGCEICYDAIGEGARSYRWRTSADGATSTAARFCHVYKEPCVDTVHLTINDDDAFSAAMVMHIYKAPAGVTASVAGNRTWRFYEGIAYSNGNSTIAYKGNTDFGIAYIDPATVLIAEDTLRLSVGYDSVNYMYTKQEPNPLGQTDAWILRLYRKPWGDSLVYARHHNIPSVGTEVKQYHSP